jgi:hypothetical protein
MICLGIGEDRGDWDGAQGRNRTTDTAIFSRMLYQLSYLGIRGQRSRDLGGYPKGIGRSSRAGSAEGRAIGGTS